MGLGFTSTVATIGVPAQLIGVSVNVTVTGDVVVLVKVPRISVEDVPLLAIPVTAVVLFLVQL